MPVTVEPSTFTMVDFDADRIAELGAELAAKAGIADDVPVRIEVDERTPVGGVQAVVSAPGGCGDVHRAHPAAAGACARTNARLPSKIVGASWSSVATW